MAYSYLDDNWLFLWGCPVFSFPATRTVHMTVLSIYTVEHPGYIGPVDIDFHHIMVCPDQSTMLDDSIVPVSETKLPRRPSPATPQSLNVERDPRTFICPLSRRHTFWFPQMAVGACVAFMMDVAWRASRRVIHTAPPPPSIYIPPNFSFTPL